MIIPRRRRENRTIAFSIPVPSFVVVVAYLDLRAEFFRKELLRAGDNHLLACRKPLDREPSCLHGHISGNLTAYKLAGCVLYVSPDPALPPHHGSMGYEYTPNRCTRGEKNHQIHSRNQFGAVRRDVQINRRLDT